MTPRADFERAEFTEARRRSRRKSWLALVGVLLLLSAVYAIARDFVYHRLVQDYAQNLFNHLGSASVESIGSVSIDGQGDLSLHDAEAYTHHRGVRRLFFRTGELRLTLDGFPMRDPRVRVMRVDLFRPEIFVRREPGGEWNLEWALVQAPRAPDLAPPGPPVENPYKDFAPTDDGFPRNGVHIHDGTINVTFVGATGKEVTWRVTGVRATLARVDGVLKLRPCRGDFYGGRLVADTEITSAHPLKLKQLTLSVQDADVAQLAAGAPFIQRAMKGRFNGAIALTYDPEKMKQRPIVSGRGEITDGDLWDVPAFSGIVHLLTLTKVSDRRIDSAVLEFTVEEDRIRVDQMHFLGYPVSLFGDGACSLTGDWMEIVFVPRLGKSDWNSILPIIGAPIDLLSNIFKGALMPVVLKGSFDQPEVAVEPLRFLRPSVKQLIEEKSPQ